MIYGCYSDICRYINEFKLKQELLAQIEQAVPRLYIFTL